MHEKNKGSKVPSHTAISISLYRLFTIALLSMFAISLFSVQTFAQNGNANARKPQLTEIILTEETNDPEALNIARSLNPDLFNIDSQYMDGGRNAVHSAVYLPLGSESDKEFIALTVTNTAFYCTQYGCPIYIYKNNGNNRWKQVLSVQANQIYQDRNSANRRNYNNLITTSITQAEPTNTIWMWNGINYQQVNRR